MTLPRGATPPDHSGTAGAPAYCLWMLTDHLKSGQKNQPLSRRRYPEGPRNDRRWWEVLVSLSLLLFVSDGAGSA